MKALHFLSGLPRSGSTLLANILHQNPRFHVSGTSGLLPFVKQARLAWAENKAFQAAENSGTMAARDRVLRGIVRSFYETVDRPVIIDKSRGWTGNCALAEFLLERRPRIIVCVRDIRDIFASLERLRQRNLLVPSPQELARPEKWDTIEGRCEIWFGPAQLVGKPFRLIRDALAQGFGSCLHFVDYLALTNEPARVVRSLYEFLGEAPFEHDFQRIEQTIVEDDAVWRMPGLHAIRPSIEPAISDWESVIPREVGKRYPGTGLWDGLIS